MNKYLIILLLIISGCSTETPIKTGYEGKIIPSFDMQTSNNYIFHSSDISSDGPIVLLYFRTDCPYCKAEIEDILDDIDNLDNYKFYFLSVDTLPQIEKFIKAYNLAGYDNIKVGYDCNQVFKNYYKTPGAPFTAIYTKEKKLNAVFFGKIGPREIKKYS